MAWRPGKDFINSLRCSITSPISVMCAAWRSIRRARRIPSFPEEEQLATGVTGGYVRLSVGLEHIDDILADLTQALEAA